MNLLQEYNNKEVLIIGGLGFIGSNLARFLNSLGAKITILTRSFEKISNLRDLENEIKIVEFSEKNMQELKNKDMIFDLAESVHRYSRGEEDLIQFLGFRKKIIEFCEKFNPHTKIIYSSSRLVYGQVDEKSLPIDEGFEPKPFNSYGKIKLESENFYMCSNLNFVIARIGVVYGEKEKIFSYSDGLVNWFIKKALEDDELIVYENIGRIRDFIYVDDLVEILSIIGVSKNTKREVFNISSGEPISLLNLARIIVNLVGSGKIVKEENFDPLDRKDSFYFDIRKAKNCLRWSPKIFIQEGIARLVNFYKGNMD